MNDNMIIAIAASIRGAGIDEIDGKITVKVGESTFKYYVSSDLWNELVRGVDGKSRWTRTSGDNVESVLRMMLKAQEIQDALPPEPEAIPVVEEVKPEEVAIVEEEVKPVTLTEYLTQKVAPVVNGDMLFWNLDNGWIVRYDKATSKWAYTTGSTKLIKAGEQNIMDRLVPPVKAEVTIDEAWENLGKKEAPKGKEALIKEAQAFANATGKTHYVFSGLTVEPDAEGVEQKVEIFTMSSEKDMDLTMKVVATCKPEIKDLQKAMLLGISPEQKEGMPVLKKIAAIERHAVTVDPKDKTAPPPFKDDVRLPWFRAYKEMNFVYGSGENIPWFRADGPYPEYSPLVELKCPEQYIELTCKDNDTMSDVIKNGIIYNGEAWKVLFGYQRDDHAKAFMVRKTSKLNDLRGIGIYLEVPDLVKCLKAGKYLNRVVAPVDTFFFALPLPGFDEESKIGTFQMPNGQKFTVRYDDMVGDSAQVKAEKDGAASMSPRFARLANLKFNAKLGDAWQYTLTSPRGTGKGHVQCIPWLDVDFVIYGTKTMLMTTLLYFSTFGKLKSGMPRTDIQSWDNFRYERPGMADFLGKALRQEIWDSVTNEDKMRRLLLKYIDIKDEDVSYYNQADMPVNFDNWLLKEALIKGVSILCHPGLFRRAYRYLLNTVMQMERGRIPMTSVARTGYVLFDPYRVDNMGRFTRPGFIGENECVFPDVPAGVEVVGYRQPNENPNAHWFMTVVYNKRYARFAGTGIILIGAGADKALGRLGGGDMDDKLIVIFDKYWVSMFHALDRYPETAKIDKEGATSGKGMYDKDDEYLGYMQQSGIDNKWYNMSHFTYQIGKQTTIGIGPVVNMNMIDHRLSHPLDKAFIMKQLDDLIAFHTKVGNTDRVLNLQIKKAWYEARIPYQMAKLATNLELVIDGNVLDANILRQLGNLSAMFTQFHVGIERNEQGELLRVPVEDIGLDGTLIYPNIATMGKNNSSRIPRIKREKNDFVILKSLMCQSLEDMTKKREMFKEALARMEWVMVKPYDEIFDVLAPVDYDTQILAGTLGTGPKGRFDKEVDQPGYIQVWNNAWKPIIEKGEINKITEIDGVKYTSYQLVENICSAWLDKLARTPATVNRITEDISIELYRNEYPTTFPDAPVWEDGESAGKRKSYPDGKLWTKRMGNSLLMKFNRMLVMDLKTKKSRPLTGLYVPVQLEREVMFDLSASSIQVYVGEGGLVFRKSTGKWIGTVPVDVTKEGVEGEYTMNGGMICLREPHKALLPVKNEDADEMEDVT